MHLWNKKNIQNLEIWNEEQKILETPSQSGSVETLTKELHSRVDVTAFNKTPWSKGIVNSSGWNGTSQRKMVVLEVNHHSPRLLLQEFLRTVSLFNHVPLLHEVKSGNNPLLHNDEFQLQPHSRWNSSYVDIVRNRQDFGIELCHRYWPSPTR